MIKLTDTLINNIQTTARELIHNSEDSQVIQDGGELKLVKENSSTGKALLQEDGAVIDTYEAEGEKFLISRI